MIMYQAVHRKWAPAQLMSGSAAKKEKKGISSNWNNQFGKKAKMRMLIKRKKKKKT